MKKLIRELHRRSVWQVLGIYLAGCWAALQVVDVLTDNFGLPAWFPALALALLVLGLPVVLATAFVQEGVGRASASEDDGVPAAAALENAATAVHHRLLTWRNAAAGGVGAFALWGVIAAGWLVLGGSGPAVPASASASAETDAAARSIAVLPFVTRSAAQEDQFFAEGMHDDLLTQLAKIEALTVISRTSVMQYANTMKTIGQIGSELGVATVLEGGVQRAGDRVRVNMQLIETGTDRHLWAETYDEELTAENVFAIQSDLARKIARALHATLSPGVERRIAARPTESLEAYDLYARGRYSLLTRGAIGEDIDGVRSFFERAIAADSGFAAAWAGLADVYLAGWNWRRIPPAVAESAATAAVSRALALDSDLAEAHLAHSRLLRHQGSLADAELAARRALELQPGDVAALAELARLLEDRGDYAGAVELSRRAAELDPLVVRSRHLLADRLFYAGRFEEAAAEAEKAVEMAPEDWYGWYNVGWAHAAAGRPARAVEALRRALGVSSDTHDPIRLAMAYAFARGSQPDSAHAYLAGHDPRTGGYDVGLVLFELGETDRAFEALEASLRASPDSYRRLKLDPTAAGLRGHPRFQELLRRVGIE